LGNYKIQFIFILKMVAVGGNAPPPSESKSDGLLLSKTAIKMVWQRER
jgi:hypothetical protein